MKLRPPEPIGPGHDAAGFDCGVEVVNRWLRRHTSAGGPQSAIFVAAEAGGRIAGFYTLAAGSVRSAGRPLASAGLDLVPILKLGRLAVDRPAQRNGLGAALVLDAVRRTYAVSRQTPVAALMADPPEAAAGWLRGLGFQRVAGDATAHFVALGTIEALVTRIILHRPF